METTDLSSLLATAKDPQIEKNSVSVQKVLKDINGFLSNVQKTADLLSGTFQKLGFPPHSIVRITGKMLKVNDIDKPIPSGELMMRAPTASHKVVFQQLASLKESELKNLQFTKKEVKTNAKTNAKAKS